MSNFYEQLIQLARGNEVGKFSELMVASKLLEQDVGDVISNLAEAEEEADYTLAKFLYCVLNARKDVEDDFWREALSDTKPEMVEFVASLRQPLHIYDLYLVQDVDLMEKIGAKYKLDSSETFENFKESLDDIEPDIYDDLAKEKQKRDILAKLYK